MVDILPKKICDFLNTHRFVIVSTIDTHGKPHNSCKGIIKITSKGVIYLLDLYRAQTLKNLSDNRNISVTAVDEHKFVGYCIKGRARVVRKGELTSEILKAWEDRVTQRITQRILRNMRGEKGHTSHPEALLPDPKYLIAVKVSEIVDLTPSHIK